MEDRTQIKFSKPDIDGSPIPQLITLEQENPIEGQTTKEDGTSFTWHKWLCTNSQYFMASETLDSMLKIMPDKTGKPLKIEKVENPKGGFPFFQINGMNRDDIVKNAPPQAMSPVMPPQMATAPASNTDGGIEQKLDQVIQMMTLLLSRTAEEPEEQLPF
jgi:hypothetical protein